MSVTSGLDRWLPYRPLTDASRPTRLRQQVALVVEQDAAVRRLVTRVLSSDFTVIEAQAAQGALQAAATAARIDLIVLDRRMPGTNAQALAASIRQRHADARVLFTSHLAADVPALRTPEFLPKPFTPSQVREQVQRLMRAKLCA